MRSETTTEKEILRVQRNEEGYTSDVPELETMFFGSSAEEAMTNALRAIAEADDISLDSGNMQTVLEDVRERVEQGIRDFQVRLEKIDTQIKALSPIKGIRAKEMLEEERFAEWALAHLDPLHPIGIKTVAFKFYKDLDKDGDMSCCVVFYRESQIKLQAK